MSGSVVTPEAPARDFEAKGRADYLAGRRDQALYDLREPRGRDYRAGWQAERLRDPGPDRPAGGTWADGRPWRPGEAKAPASPEKVAPRQPECRIQAVQRPAEPPKPAKKAEATSVAPRIEQQELF
jgi:hypothetical protein